MLFNSTSFFLFLPLVWLVFRVSPERLRWVVLLAASVAFYAALKAPLLLGALAMVCVATGLCGRWLHQEPDPGRKIRLLWMGIAANLLVLAALKYLPAVNGVLSAWWHHNLVSAEYFVTIGVSYYTFQAISYLVDIYLGTATPEPHWGRLVLYLGFFPKLLQGPIERAGDLLPQLRAPYQFKSVDVREGLLLFTWGLFKKLVVADRLAGYVNAAYGDPNAQSGLSLWVATYFYAIQIYADFSGYTDMALGVARLFNIRLTPNFNLPYQAVSVAEFWRRWHMTFSRWILDYIFKPLQFSWRDRGNGGTALALLVTFLACGLWHGNSLGFIVWGLLHGTYLASSVFYRPHQKRFHQRWGLEHSRGWRLWRTVVTFHLVAFAWIFFRSPDLATAWAVIGGLGRFAAAGFTPVATTLAPGRDLAFVVCLILAAGLYEFHRDKLLARCPLLLNLVLVFLQVWLTIVYGVYDSRQFIYFQF